MKVVVLGGGVVGVTSAYYLAKAGHEVLLVDRRAGVGMETSLANAGMSLGGDAGNLNAELCTGGKREREKQKGVADRHRWGL